MALLPLRTLEDRPATSVARDWLTQIRATLDDPSTDRSRLCR